jgi:hypothetical protein
VLHEGNKHGIDKDGFALIRKALEQFQKGKVAQVHLSQKLGKVEPVDVDGVGCGPGDVGADRPPTAGVFSH